MNMGKDGWSKRAREDFDERKEYRKERGEEDRYKKKDDEREEDREETAEDAREDRRDERGYEWGEDDLEADLMQLRNASPDENVDEALDRLRARYNWYEEQYDRLDRGYAEMYDEVDKLRRENRRYMMRDSYGEARRAERAIKESQNKDIVEDGEIQSIDELWDNREG